MDNMLPFYDCAILVTSFGGSHLISCRQVFYFVFSCFVFKVCVLSHVGFALFHLCLVKLCI